MKKEDINFKAVFFLTAGHNDYLHAISAYFNVEFSRCHKPIRLSTSPFTVPTHWKQITFYLKSIIAIKKGETIHGSFQMRDIKNRREIEIDIFVDFEGILSKVKVKSKYIIK